MTDLSKSTARQAAKLIRAKVTGRPAKAQELCRHFPLQDFKASQFAGYWPLQTEMDLRPLMAWIAQSGAPMALPITGKAGTALSFREWTPGTKLQAGRFGTMEPPPHAPPVTPDFIFLPLLAFSPHGDRLGYGGGYYDRTLANLRKAGQVFACGVGFDAQEMQIIPTGPYDVKLEAVLTPSGFRRFAS